eukprot:Hpha_TRINITY_DN16044_c0_g1::TRINITY_DN16044_c0_g1_i1::g.120128::m.120128
MCPDRPGPEGEVGVALNHDHLHRGVGVGAIFACLRRPSKNTVGGDVERTGPLIIVLAFVVVVVIVAVAIVAVVAFLLTFVVVGFVVTLVVVAFFVVIGFVVTFVVAFFVVIGFVVAFVVVALVVAFARDCAQQQDEDAGQALHACSVTLLFRDTYLTKKYRN